MSKNISHTTEHKTNNEIVDVRKKKFWKFATILFLLLVGMLVVVAKLFYIQIINFEYYKKLGQRQQQIKEKIIPQRGNIYDRNGKLLASSIKSLTIAVDPTVLKNKDTLAILIDKYIGISKEEILKKINSSKGQYVRLCHRITPDKAAPIIALKERKKDIGIILKDEPIRNYNYSQTVAQIIGSIGIDNSALNGLELQYDTILRGKPGYEIMYKDVKQRLRPAINLPSIPAENGADLHLTLDIELQKIVEFELMQGVINSDALSGTIVALEPNTGEVLACMSYPSYNPNAAFASNLESTRIRSVTDVYEPGSTFKSITTIAGLEEKSLKPTDMFNGYNGLYEQASFEIKDEIPLGMTTFITAFEKSSNIILSEVALKIPSHKFYKYIRDFGFGLKTGIDLPGELSGRLPKFDFINVVDKRFLGFGYGIMVTPIQLVSAYSAIANGGHLMQPFIVNKISKNEEVIAESKPLIIRDVMSDKTVQTMNNLLVGVVQNGTATRTYIKDLKIAGKTGTAQVVVSGAYSKSNHIASFVGYYPADNPKICMLIIVEQPKTHSSGGMVAAPIFRNIALRYASVSSDILNSVRGKQDEIASKKTVYVPELKGLQTTQAESILADVGLKIQSNNPSGVIMSQIPKAGAKVPLNTSILLHVEDIATTGDILGNNTAKIQKTDLPNVKGMSLRRAISLLHNLGFKTNVTGSGVVISQNWQLDSKKEYFCYLKCK